MRITPRIMPYRVTIVVALLLVVGSAAAVKYQLYSPGNALIKGNLDVVGAFGGGFDPITLKNSETIDNVPDDMIDFVGVGGTANTDLRLDLDGTQPELSSVGATRISLLEDVTVLGDLTITGDDIFATTNTIGATWVGDGTNYNPVVVSGDAVISAAGVVAIQANSVALTTDTTGNYVGTVTTSALTGLTGGAAGSEGTAITLDWDYSATLAADPALLASRCVPSTTGFICEGSIADGFEALLVFVNPTADRTHTFPDRTGTVVLSGDTFTTDVTGTVDASGATALTVAANAVALGADTTNNYVESANTSVLTGLTGGAAGSESAALSLAFSYAATLAADPALAASNCVFASTGLICEGSGADASEVLITFVNPTADRTFTFPDVTGTVATIDNAQTFTAALTLNAGTTFGALADENWLCNDATCNLAVADGGSFVFENATGTDAMTIVAATGNATFVGDVTITGDDLFMTTNTTGAVLVGDGTNFNPVVMGTDATISAAGALVIAANAVAAAEITDLAQDYPIPLRSWVDCDGATYADLTFCASGADALPDFLCGGAAGVAPGLVIEFDATGGSVDASTEICGDTKASNRWVSGGSLAVVVNKSAETGASEVLNCAWSINGAALGTTGTVTITGAAGQEVICTPGGALSAGASVHAVLWITSGGTMDDAVRIIAVALRETDSQ